MPSVFVGTAKLVEKWRDGFGAKMSDRDLSIIALATYPIDELGSRHFFDGCINRWDILLWHPPITRPLVKPRRTPNHLDSVPLSRE